MSFILAFEKSTYALIQILKIFIIYTFSVLKLLQIIQIYRAYFCKRQCHNLALYIIDRYIDRKIDILFALLLMPNLTTEGASQICSSIYIKDIINNSEKILIKFFNLLL